MKGQRVNFILSIDLPNMAIYHILFNGLLIPTKDYYYNTIRSSMDFLKKCCQCYFCSYAACNTAMCIDQWHSIEACGLAYLYCDACCWTLCAPLCIDCKLGDTGKACENCTRGLKYCLFSCALSFVGCIDGLYNCFEIIKLACGEGVKGYADLTKHTEFLANKVKQSLGLQTGNEPMRSMGTFSP